MLTIEPGMRVSGALPSVETAAARPDRGAVFADTLSGGRVVSTIHVGPYESLADAYAALEAWMTSNGRTPAGAPWESYITDPAEHPDPKAWQTEVVWPIE